MKHESSAVAHQDVGRSVAGLLRFGVSLSALVIMTGLMTQLAHPGPLMDGGKLLTGGILLLIFLPFVRVAWLSVSFARHRDWLYAGASLMVLALLCLGFWIGIR